MKPHQTLEDFYKEKLNWVPDHLRTEIGHFNVFRLDDFVGAGRKPVPYNRKDYFKISLIIGRNRIFYADKVIEIQRQALLFANPQIPYTWEAMDEKQSGFFCVFTPAFFDRYGNFKNYGMLQPGGNPVYELTDEQVAAIGSIYQRMFAEMRSDYVHKYDVIRNLIFDIMHQADRLQPARQAGHSLLNGTRRTAMLFLELLEQQFPVESIRQRLILRSPADFADQLAIHVNYLNRTVKEATGKTTSELIASRILQEAKALLLHTTWNVAEIAWCLGYTEVTHFNNFFKKHLQLNPSQFRKV